MSFKQLFKKFVFRLAKSSLGARLAVYSRGISGIINDEVNKQYNSDMHARLSVSGFFKAKKEEEHGSLYRASVQESSEGKIKIRFFHCGASTFSVIQTVCECFREDDRYDLLIVLFGNSYAGMVRQMQEQNFKFVEDYKYDLSTDLPDISVIYHLEIPYPPQLENIRKFSKYVALVPLGIGSIWFGRRTVERMNLHRYNADMCCVGNLCYDRLIHAIGQDKIERISPAQFDLAYRKFLSALVYPSGWEKLKGKKTVMWMTDHGIREYSVSDEVSFDLYFKTILDYCNAHPDFGFIFRLHPSLIQELVSTFWTVQDYLDFVDGCAKSPNIVWDDTDDYLIGLHVSDACMVDVNCSLVYFALAANKPLAVPLRYDMDIEITNPELVDNYYKIQSDSELVSFFDMVRQSQDTRKSERQSLFDKYIETFDGNNGRRIYHIIARRYNEFQGNG